MGEVRVCATCRAYNPNRVDGRGLCCGEGGGYRKPEWFCAGWEAKRREHTDSGMIHTFQIVYIDDLLGPGEYNLHLFDEVSYGDAAYTLVTLSHFRQSLSDSRQDIEPGQFEQILDRAKEVEGKAEFVAILG